RWNYFLQKVLSELTVVSTAVTAPAANSEVTAGPARGVQEVEDAAGHGGTVREERVQFGSHSTGPVLVGDRRDGVEDRHGDGVRPPHLADRGGTPFVPQAFDVGLQARLLQLRERVSGATSE